MKIISKYKLIKKIKWFFDNHYRIKNTLIVIISLSILSVLTFFEYKYHFIKINCEPIILSISIFTMYGIFITAIQFLINYSITNKNDIYWGKSKTKLIVMESTEYKIFNSIIFRMLFLYMCLFSVFDINRIEFIAKFILKSLIGILIFLSKYNIIDIRYLNLTRFAMCNVEALIKSFYNISVMIVLLEFIFFFIKSITISNILFYERENNYVIERIEGAFFTKYELSLGESIETEKNYFIKRILYDLQRVETSQREEMVYSIVINAYRKYSFKLNRSRCKILKQYPGYRLKRLHEINMEFWEHYEKNNLQLTLKKLLKIYFLQADIIYNFAQKYFEQNKEVFESKFENVYMMDNVYQEVRYFDYPAPIWKSISSTEDLILLSKQARKLPIINLINYPHESKEYSDSESFRKYIIGVYCDIIIKVIDMGKNLKPQINKDIIKSILDIQYCADETFYMQFNENNFNNRHEGFLYLQKQILMEKLLNYIESLENSEFHQKYIKELIGFIDRNYLITYITYRLLDVDYHNSNWKKEILFFRSLLNYRYYQENIFSKQDIDFAAEMIENNKIGRSRNDIESRLITWIFDNIMKPIDEDMINECLRKRYLSLDVFISFRYIFHENNFYYREVGNMNFLNDDYKIQFINDISIIKDIKKEKYFRKILYSVIDCNKFNINQWIEDGIFESFVFCSFFMNIKMLLKCIETNDYIENDDIYKFLLIEFSEVRPQVLIQSLSATFRQNLVERYEKILLDNNKSLEEFVDDICGRASRVGMEITGHRKNRIIEVLRLLVY